MTIDKTSNGKTYAIMEKLSKSGTSFLVERKSEDQNVLSSE